MSRVFSLRTKLEVAGTICLLISLSLVSVFAVTRTISDTGDTVETFIRNSNGNYYTATFANLQTSLNLGGVTTLPVCNITIGASGLSMSIDGTQLKGQGTSSLLFLSAGANYRNMINVTAENCLIENIRFDVNNASQTLMPTIIRAIFLDNGAWNATVRRCLFYRGSYTLIDTVSSSLQGRHLIEENYIDGRQTTGYGSGITIRGAGNIVRNNRIKDTYAAGITCEGSAYITKDNLIDGNIISGYVATCIYSEGTACDNTTIVNNICLKHNSPAYGGTTVTYGILTNGNVTVANNQIYDSPYFGIACGGNGGKSTKVVVTGNRIYNIWVHSGISVSSVESAVITDNIITRTTESGITVSYTKHIVISNNIITETTYSFIYVKNSIDAIISDNLMNDCATEGIYIDCDNPAYIIISNNLINDTTHEGIYIYGAPCNCKVNINHNTIMNCGQQGINMPVVTNDSIVSNNFINETTGDGIFIDSTSTAHRIEVSNNIVDSVGGYGIRLVDAQNSSVNGNIVTDNSLASTGIQLMRVYNTTAMLNRVYGFSKGIEENTAANWNDISHNNCQGCTTPFTHLGANTIHLGCRPTVP